MQNVLRHLGVNNVEQILRMSKGGVSIERNEEMKMDEWTNIVE